MKCSHSKDIFAAQVRHAALVELAKFDWTDHKLEHLPDFCKSNLKQPPISAAEAEGAEEAEMPDHVPGEVWLQLISKPGASKDDREALAGFVSSLVAKEVDALPRSAFSLTQVSTHL